MLDILGSILLLTALSIMAVQLLRRQRRRDGDGEGWSVDGAGGDSGCDGGGDGGGGD